MDSGDGGTVEQGIPLKVFPPQTNSEDGMLNSMAASGPMDGWPTIQGLEAT
jgi:hypothetical protein